MDRKQKIQELLNRLDDLQATDPVRSVERLLTEEQQKAKEAAGSPNGTALKVLARGLAKVQNDPRPDELASTIEQAKAENQGKLDEITASFDEKIQSLIEEVKAVEGKGQQMTQGATQSVLDRVAEAHGSFAAELNTLKTQDSAIEAEVKSVAGEIEKLNTRFDTLPGDPTAAIEEKTTRIITETGSKAAKDIEELRKDLTNRINSIQRGGGNMNRSIVVGGDLATLSRYTDINLKAGAGTTITYSANNTTKFTDITITATGTGSGITRSVSTVAVDTAAAASPSVDYVYLASGTLTITLPTSVGNSNLYTIKNIGAGTVTIATTGGETIDGSANLVLPLQFTSVDLISNNSGNWDIT